MCLGESRLAVFSSSGLERHGDFVLCGLRFWEKTLDTTFGGCNRQWRICSCFLVEGIVSILDLLEGENLGS
jgi:hypothetical protein